MKIKYLGELWADIKGYVGLYQVSNFGRVRNIKTGRILKTRTGRDYYQLNLHRECKMKTYKVHRLVAESFIPNPKHLPIVNHKDENKLNNRLSNLEWCSAKYNTNYGTAKYRSAGRRGKPIVQYSKTGEYITWWKSAAEAAKHLNGVDKNHIYDVCKGKKKSHAGFVWKYKRDVVA